MPLQKEIIDNSEGNKLVGRNHIIADLFARIHFGEKMGTGFERIKEICGREKAPYPKIEFDEHYFYVTFKQSYEYLKLAGKATVEKTVEKILGLMKENPKITQKELIQKTGLTRRGVEWNIKKLKKEGKIKRLGGRKEGYWKVVEK